MTERIVVAALLVALCGCARPNKPLGQVSDGIAVRLTADSRVWTEGEDPRFSVVLRNDSTQQLSTSLIASLALEIDGTPYAPLVWFSLGTIGNSPFGPGAQYAITLSLSYFGADDLRVGKHTVRAAYLDNINAGDGGIITSLQGYPEMVLAFSEAVEIEIIAQSEDNTSK